MTTLPTAEPPPELETRLLLVDDDPYVLSLLEAAVTGFGYACETAPDGETAVEKLKTAPYTIVITDMTMPGIDGMELLRHIKSEYPRIEVIVITGYTERYTYTDVIRTGASDFLAKPFNADELEAKISRVIREQRLIQKLEHLSMCDVLTDLFNRRCFDMKLHEEIPRAHRQGYPVFLALFDVDGFKEYNDLHGHQAGDRVLQDIGRIMTHSTRENVDWCFRFGGDEFAAIIPYATIEQVGQIVERILSRYRERPEYADTSLSAGLAQFVRHPGRSWPEDLADLVARADKALYQSKEKGGNQMVADPSVPILTAE
ncbi:MAG: diguanylate cyclase domain-containing protein [Thermodesulfobacteriota bacterium]